MAQHAVDGNPVTRNKLNFPPLACGAIEDLIELRLAEHPDFDG